VSSWGKAIGFGALVWLIPFAVAFLVFALRDSERALFESIMAVTVTASAVILGLAYMRRVRDMPVREGLLLGILWFVICVLIDAPLMLFGGPMHMTLPAYMGDIGLTYLIIPIVTIGLGMMRSSGGTQKP
jgi:hypothetical protein